MPMSDPKPKSAAQRKADERERHKAAGRVAVTVWIKPKHRVRLSKFLQRLRREE